MNAKQLTELEAKVTEDNRLCEASLTDEDRKHEAEFDAMLDAITPEQAAILWPEAFPPNN